MTTAIISLATLGLLFGGLLAIASNAFAVEVDPREEEVLEALPGANCGACGYPGCAGFATAVAKGNAPITGCPVGGSNLASTLGTIMGADVATDEDREVALVMCKGGTEVANNRYEYHGLGNCAAAHSVAGGFKSCEYGCLGLGDCFEACPFDAITMSDDGLPIIDEEKCTACNQCVIACPRDIISLVPVSKRVHVKCISLAKGKEVRKSCQVGCIACTLCARNCPQDTIEIKDNIARIIYDDCTNCGLCVEKCPMNTIDHLDRA